MSYQAVVAGVVTVLEGVSGLDLVLDYEPKSIQQFPLCYLLFDSASGFSSGVMRGMRYRLLIRLCLLWQDNEQAERELEPYINSIPAALAADRQLSGALTSGLVDMDSLTIDGGFARIAGIVVRTADFYIEVVDKNP